MGLQLIMKRFLLLSLLTAMAVAQEPLAPSPAQHKKLLAKRAAVLQMQFKISQLQAQLAFQFQELGQMCRQVILENSWPANAQCDQNTLLFIAPAPPVPPAPRPAEEKK